MERLALVTLISVALVGCGGDSSSDTSADLQATSKTLNGYVDAISYSDKSISVNDVTMNADNASVQYQSQSYPLEMITKGTHINADLSDDIANNIELDPEYTGQVSKIIDDNITVNNMVFTYAALSSDITVGDWVLISAQVHADSSWKVTSINEISALSFSEIEGSISQLDINAFTFMIGNVLVDYSNAILDDIQVIQNGLWVEVSGQYQSGKIVASKVDAESASDYNDTDVEGIISWVNSTQTVFELNQRTTIMVDESTRYDDGNQSMLTVGFKVNVDLKVVNGKLVAIEVDFDDDTGIQGREFNVEGEASYNNSIVSINGIDFPIGSNTVFDDGLTINTLAGQWVELDGRDVNGQFVLKEIEREDKDNEISLEGLVSSGQLWGYSSSDGSLGVFNGQWVDIECQRDASNNLSFCRLDPN